ncbi:alpha/beta hydrolase [Oleomonas cavernae]|uniref:Alpha/beta hydrolase n=2 Tax=Oleomonas cavernae TaxID=2320859 RepID=A0A418WH26_9PROT|nr:alpha/beta hydrolase [Oleomonas cavernae]
MALAVWGVLFLITFLISRHVKKTMPPPGKFIEIDGHAIHYTDEGQGPTLLLIHGLGGQTGNFAYLTDYLKAGYRVVALDRPGNGYSTKPAGAPSGIVEQARIIARFIAALDLDQPVIVGHSLGGAVALAIALNHSKLIAGAALLAPLTQHETEPPEAFKGLIIRSPWLRRLVAWTLAIPSSILNGKRIGSMVFAPDAIPADFVGKTRGLLSLRPSAFYATSSDLVAAPDDLPGLVARYGTLSVPVGILYGSNDRILDALVHGKATAAIIPGAVFEMVAGAGHMIPVTAPERSAGFIKHLAEVALSTDRVTRNAPKMENQKHVA